MTRARPYAAVDALTAGSDAPGDALRRTDERLQAAQKRFTPRALSPEGTTVPYDADAELTGLGPFAWSSRLRLVETGDGWRVAFDSATVHPRLVRGQRLDRQGQPGPRAVIADRTGAPVRPASADLAANVLGRAGADPSGLERVLEARLAGRTGGAVVVAGPAAQVQQLQRYEAAPAAPVRTTLDLRVQAAAEQALAGVGPAAALVAVDSATGQVRAVANSPVTGKPAAFTSWAPGSVFKTVTAAALLQDGLRPDSPLGCPATHRGTGNASSVRPGPTTLSGAFAQSCNTAFLAAAEQLPEGALAASAAAFGFGPEPLLPIAVDASDFPTASGPGDATAPIGQGRVEATPLLVASLMAAVESGTWRQPSLLPDQEGATRPLPEAVTTGLRTLLRAAVADGSARAADLPGAPVSGKTGSAETGDGPEVHAWFAGYRDGLAFAVFVQRGRSGSETAVPVAVRFLRAL